MKTKPCCECGTAVVALPDEERWYSVCSTCWWPMHPAEISRKWDAHTDGTTDCRYHRRGRMTQHTPGPRWIFDRDMMGAQILRRVYDVTCRECRSQALVNVACAMWACPTCTLIQFVARVEGKS